MARGFGGMFKGGSRRTTMGALVAAGVAALAAWVLIQTVDRLTAHQHRRAFHDLAIVTDSLAMWPRTIRSMAATNLLPTRLEGLRPDDADGDNGERWQAQARFWHPELGRFRIRYRLTGTAGCAAGALPRAGGGETRLTAEQLVVRGALPLGALIEDDRAAGAISSVVDANAFVAWLNTAPRSSDPGTLRPAALAAAEPATVCYEAKLPIAELVDLHRVAPEISHLLLAERDDVRVQLATDRLAVFDLARLPLRSALIATFAEQSGVRVGDRGPTRLGDALEPVKASVGGVDYLAYVRRFALAEGTEPVVALALVPEAQVRSRVLRPPPMPMALFELTVLLLLTITPIIKLRLIGESEALEKLEVTALALGVLASAAILTLTIGFAIDVTARRGAVDDRLVATAETLRGHFDADMRDLVKPLRDDRAVGGRCADGLPFATAYAPRLDGAAGAPDDPIPPRAVRETIGAGIIRVPLVESVFIADNVSGRQAPGSFIVTCRAETDGAVEVGARLDVLDRPYFRDAVAGRVEPIGRETRISLGAPAVVEAGDQPLWVWQSHSSAAVRSQSDGIVKTVLAFPAWFGQPRQTAPVSPNAVAAVAANLRSLTSPALARGERYMVVDLDRPGLPVLFHSNPTRALVERFVDETPDIVVARRIVSRLRDDRRVGPLKFVADYDGAKQRFVAVALPRTSWALLVWQPSADPESVALGTVNWALALWAIFGMFIGGGVLIARWSGRALIGIRRFKARARHRSARMRISRFERSIGRTRVGRVARRALGWPSRHHLRRLLTADPRRADPAWRGPRERLLQRRGRRRFSNFVRGLLQWFDPGTPRRLSALFWIDQRRTAAYRRFAFTLGLGQAAIATLMLGLDAYHAVLALLSIILTLFALLWLGRQPLDPAHKVLNADSELQFGYAFVAVVVGLAILPAAGFYRDAAAFAARTGDYAEHRAASDALRTRADALRGLARAFYPSVRTMVTPNILIDGRGRAVAKWRAVDRRPLIGLTERLQITASPNSAPSRIFDTARASYITTDPAGAPAIDIVEWISIGFAAAGATALLGAIVGTIFTQLFGVGRPIESVPYPLFPAERAGQRRPGAGERNALDDLELNPKTMIVDPPLFVQQTLFDYGRVVDLAGEQLTPLVGSEAPNAAQPLYVFHNLELTLRNPERRLAALDRLEKIVASEAVRNGKVWVVLLSDLSPLERLLQAYERDREELGEINDTTKAERLAQLRRNREDIRWSRLFEDFQTYVFATLPKLDVARWGQTPIKRRILAEIAPLPENVIATLLPPGAVAHGGVRFDVLAFNAAKPAEQRHKLPLTPPAKRALRMEMLDARYGAPVARWADSLESPSEAAAIDFLAQMLIEHYEQLWASSSRAERLLLHHLAHGRAISMAAINPLSSLIRRGLVTMDPVPRLMNKSFEQFVGRAEKPERFAMWRAEAPRGAWQRAVGPLLIVLPLGLFALVWVVIESGQPVASLLPLMAAAGPALLQTLGMMRRAGAS